VISQAVENEEVGRVFAQDLIGDIGIIYRDVLGLRCFRHDQSLPRNPVNVSQRLPGRDC